MQQLKIIRQRRRKQHIGMGRDTTRRGARRAEYDDFRLCHAVSQALLRAQRA